MGFDVNAPSMYITQVRWQFAKTMPDWPHEYTVKDWRPELAESFEAFCRLILADGTVEPWPPPPEAPIYHHRYLVVDDHKYWTMGLQGVDDSVTEKTVINRTAVVHVESDSTPDASPE